MMTTPTKYFACLISLFFTAAVHAKTLELDCDWVDANGDTRTKEVSLYLDSDPPEVTIGNTIYKGRLWDHAIVVTDVDLYEDNRWSINRRDLSYQHDFTLKINRPYSKTTFLGQCRIVEREKEKVPEGAVF